MDFRSIYGLFYYLGESFVVMSTDDAQSSFLTIPFFGVIASVTLILAR
uniref:Phage protein n=1 Tax=Ascaris lumbricoides TaxID=6252 RepID=A0A0M3HK76_ASCLU